MQVIYKCHACGASVSQNNNEKSAVCEYCGETVVFPKTGFAQMNRANELRSKKQFDDALFIYEDLLKKTPNDAEIWWNIFLCKYGVEYVEDSGGKKPTIRRMSYDPMLENEAYKKAIAFSDDNIRHIYEKEAKKLAEIQDEYLKVISQEEPYDVFISFKDKDDETGERTRDGEWAQLIYNNLSDRGYKVFFSRITLRPYAGTKYEPRIFAALQSASVMIVVACSVEHVNAPWVKNEWSRFLELRDRNPKKSIFPVYADMSPAMLPSQLAAIQGYEANGTDFISKLVKDIDNRIGRKREEQDAQQVVQVSVQGDYDQTQLKRNIELGFRHVEKKDWEEADAWFEEALNYSIDSAIAWWGKLIVKTKDFSVKGDFRQDPETEKFFLKAMEHATEEEKKIFESDLERNDAVQKAYNCEELLDEYSEKTNKFSRFWISDNDSDRENNALLDKLEEKMLSLASGKRKDEIEETIGYYKIRRQRIKELDYKFRETEDENRRIAYDSTKIKGNLDEKRGLFIKGTNSYPVVTWLWLIGIFIFPVMIIALIKTIANASNRKKLYGIDSKQLKKEIADLQAKYTEQYKICQKRIKALVAIYAEYGNTYKDVKNYVLPTDIVGHISGWEKKFGIPEYEKLQAVLYANQSRSRTRRFFVVTAAIIVAVSIIGSSVVPKIMEMSRENKVPEDSSGNAVNEVEKETFKITYEEIEHWRDWEGRRTFSVNDKHGFLAIDKESKRIIKYGCDRLSFEDGRCKSVSLSSTNNSAAVVREDGTVYITGNIEYKADVSSWTDVCSVQTSDIVVIALTSDGSLLSSSNGTLATDIKQFYYYSSERDSNAPDKSSDFGLVIAAKKDGSVYCNDSNLASELSGWSNVAYIVSDNKGSQVMAVTNDNTLLQYGVSYDGSVENVAFPICGHGGFKVIYLNRDIYSERDCKGFKITVDKNGKVSVSNTGGISDEMKLFVSFIRGMQNISVD